MDIVYDSANRVFKIDTVSSSYLIGIVDDEGFIAHIYYGPRIADTNLTYLLRTKDYPWLPSTFNRERANIIHNMSFEFPSTGVGDFRSSSIRITDENGHHASMFYYEDYEIIDGKPKLNGLPSTFAGSSKAKTLNIIAKEPVLNIKAVLSYSIFEDSDAILRSVRIINESDKTIHLNKALSFCFDFEDDKEYDFLTLNGSWARERLINKRPIGYGKIVASSNKGKSSHQENPFMALVGANAGQEYGDVYGFNFIYSGNFTAEVERSQYDLIRIGMGINPENFDWELKSKEEFQTPEAVCVYSDKGLGKMTRTFHDLYRNHLIRSPYLKKDRPILLNCWEATYFDFDTEKIISIAKEAKKSGIDMIVIDDGWFGERNNDDLSLGDWQVNENKIKGGLKYLVDEVNKIGLKFGIWFEPEMVSLNSNLYRKHPEWIIHVPERTPTQSRAQFVLDITNPEVRDYVYESVANILRNANIEYVKWDMNRELCDIGSAALGKENQGEVNHRYVLALYELQERLITEFPNLLLEHCSAGGARFDPGILYYSPQIWASDDTDAVERLAIQEGTALVYPFSCISAHVSDCPNHQVGRVTPFKTRGDVALCGAFGYELDITKISQEDRDMVPGQVDAYHKYHMLYETGDYYRLLSARENGNYDAFSVVSKDKSEALVTYVQILAKPNRHSKILKLSGLNSDYEYRVEGTKEKYKGDTLMNAGLLIDNMQGDFKSLLIHLTKV